MVFRYLFGFILTKVLCLVSFSLCEDFLEWYKANDGIAMRDLDVELDLVNFAKLLAMWFKM